MFSVTSRYYNIETVMMKGSDGREIIYIRRRFLPPASSSIPMTEHVVNDGERLDNITARYLGDPEQFWRLCDANNAMKPGELTATSTSLSASVTGRRLIIPIIQGG
jgi:hypothetical protein